MPLTSGDILRYNGTNWSNQPNTISNLNDTNVASPSNNQVLTYNSSTSKWTNQNPNQGFSSVIINDLADDNTVINAPCDEYGTPEYISIRGKTVTVVPIKVRAQGQVFTTVQTSLNLDTLFGTNPHSLYFVYADYNSGSPVIGISRVRPETFYRRTFTTGSYLALNTDYSDPFLNVWTPDITTASLITANGTTGYNTNAILQTRIADRSSSLEDTYYPPILAYMQDFTFDLFFYAASNIPAGTYFVTSNNAGGLGVHLYFNTTNVLGLYVSSDGTTWNVINNSICGTIIVGAWNYVGVKYNGVYITNLNGNIVTTSQSTYPTITQSIGMNPIGVAQIANFLLTPFDRPWRTTFNVDPDMILYSTEGSTFASCLNMDESKVTSTGILDDYGFNWYSRGGVIQGANSITGLSIQLGGTRFLHTTSFPMLRHLSEWTIEFYFYSASLTGNLFDCRPRGGTNIFNLVIYTNTPNQVSFYLSTDGTTWNVFNNTPHTINYANQWVHVALTYSVSQGYRTYINGAAGPSSSNTGICPIHNLCTLARDANGTIRSAITQYSDFRVTPWVVYNNTFTSPTTRLTMNASRDLIRATNNTVETQGLNSGLKTRVYIGMLRRLDASSTGYTIQHYAKAQNITPALTLAATNSNIRRDLSISNPRMEYSLLSNNECTYLYNMFLRGDGTVWVTTSPETGNFVLSTTSGSVCQIHGLPRIKQISVSMRAAMFVDYDGQVWALGVNHQGVFGNGSAVSAVIRIPTIVYTGTDPVVTMISNSFTFGAIGTTTHCSFIQDSGSIFAAGKNDLGQLGIGSVSANVLQFTQVPKQGGNNWGGFYSNGRSSYFWTDSTSGNILYACGLNTSSQLGTGTATNVSTLTQCIYANTTPVNNVKKVCSSIQTETPVASSVVLLNSGETYISGRANLGTRSQLLTIPNRGWVGPFCYDIKDICMSGGENDGSMLLLRYDNVVLSSYYIFAPDLRSSPMPVLLRGWIPIVDAKFIQSVEYDGISNGSIVTQDGRLISTNIGGPAYTSTAPDITLVRDGWELKFPKMIDSVKYNSIWVGAANPADKRFLHAVKLVDGSIYVAGNQQYTGSTLSYTSSMIPMILP